MRLAEYEIGGRVSVVPARRPERITLPGRLISIVPLDQAEHGEALYAGTHGSEAENLWRYMFEGPFPNAASFEESLSRKMRSEDPLFFTIIENASGHPLGFAAYMRIDPIFRTIEVGHVMYLPALQKTPGATEAMYLMARHCFEDLGYRRYEWKCHALNKPSRKAAQRLGFSFEGVFRQHMIIKGRNRDTAWFSMLDSEWPARKAVFERWLDPSNFDNTGRQKTALSAFRRPLK